MISGGGIVKEKSISEVVMKKIITLTSLVLLILVFASCQNVIIPWWVPGDNEEEEYNPVIDNGIVPQFDPEDFAFTVVNDVVSGNIPSKIMSTGESGVAGRSSRSGSSDFIGTLTVSADISEYAYQDYAVDGSAIIELEFNTSGLESYALRSNVDFDRYSNVVIDVPSSSASGSGVSQEDVLVGNGLPEISNVDLGMPDGNSTVSVNGGMTKRFKDIFRNAEVPITLNDLPSDTVSISLVMTNMVNTVFKIEYDPGKITERTDDTEIMKINDSGSSYIVFDSQTHNKKRIVLEDYSSSYFYGFGNIDITTSGKYSFDIIDASSGNTFRNVFTNFVLEDFSISFESLGEISSNPITTPVVSGTLDLYDMYINNDDISKIKMDLNVGGHRYIDYGGYAVNYLLFRFHYAYIRNNDWITGDGNLPSTDKEINVQGYCRSIGNGEYNLNGKVSTLDNQIAMEFDIDLVKNSDGCRIIRCKLDDVQLGALAIRYFEMLSFV